MVILLLVMFLNENASRCANIRGVDQPFEGGLIMAVYRISEPVEKTFGKNNRVRLVADYRCDCGKVFTIQCRSENTNTSCGCLRKKQMAGNTRGRTHNAVGTPTHTTWRCMKERCLQKCSTEYARYGGRGISICDRWMSFVNFLEDMGEKPSGYSIDRIDPNGNYEPGNCRWATATEQARNTRRNRILTIHGMSKTVAEWSECDGAATSGNIASRLHRGWSHTEAVFGKAQPCKT
jgi:hypothetical protein